jgi:hypothetical protein
MQSPDIVKKKGAGNVLKTFASLLLLTIYLAGSIQVDVLHQVLHAHDNAVAHTAEQEKDACHLSVYHQQKNKGCDHDAHFVKRENCNFCHAVFHSEPIVLPHLSVKSFQFCVAATEKFKSFQLAEVDSHLSPRAPPVS